MNYHETDPEFMERFEHFAFEEVVKEEGQQLEPRTRYLAILASLIGCQGVEAYGEILPKALEAGLSPAAVKETVYQAADYLGMGRMWPFLRVTNEIFSRQGIALPLSGQATTTMEDRLEKGIQAQADIFGEHMKEAWKAGHVSWADMEGFYGLPFRDGPLLCLRNPREGMGSRSRCKSGSGHGGDEAVSGFSGCPLFSASPEGFC